jgi:hypothetical protein
MVHPLPVPKLLEVLQGWAVSQCLLEEKVNTASFCDFFPQQSQVPNVMILILQMSRPSHGKVKPRNLDHTIRKGLEPDSNSSTRLGECSFSIDEALGSIHKKQFRMVPEP